MERPPPIGCCDKRLFTKAPGKAYMIGLAGIAIGVVITTIGIGLGKVGVSWWRVIAYMGMWFSVPGAVTAGFGLCYGRRRIRREQWDIAHGITPAAGAELPPAYDD